MPGIENDAHIVLLDRVDEQQQRIDLMDELETAILAVSRSGQEIQGQLLHRRSKASASVRSRSTWNWKFSWNGRCSQVGTDRREAAIGSKVVQTSSSRPVVPSRL